MGVYSLIFAAVTVTLALRGSMAAQVVAVPFVDGHNSPYLGRYAKRLFEIIVFFALFSFTMLAWGVSAHAQTVSVNSLTANPTTVQPGQTVVFSATMTASANASNYVEFSLIPPGASAGTNPTQGVFFLTFMAGAPLTETYSWTVPAGTNPGAYTMQLAVFDPAWSSLLALKSAVLTIAAAGVAAAPTNLEPPVVSGTAQVGKVLASTTGTWTGATSYAYEWAGNGAGIAGATAATYTPVSNDGGHTLTATVTATGPGGAASATSAPTVPIVAASSGSASAASSGSGSFVALHTYYMSPTGSDSNNGLTVATAWATPNHAGIICGDVIIAQPGAYTRQFIYWQNPTGCPSTSGGIDGTGGVYFATVVCATAFACTDTQPSGSVFRVNANNWAIEGWSASAPEGFTYLADATATGTTIIHHVAFINDIAANSDDGFTTGDGGKNHNVPGNGVDQFAVVGSIAYNSNQDPICVAAMDDVAPANYDSSSGTHVFWAGNFAFSNMVKCGTDGEGMMFDTWDAHGYTGQGVIENNVIWQSERYGLNIYYQGLNAGNAMMYVFNNTFFSNNAGATGTANWAVGDINVQSLTSALPYPISIYNNISRTNYATTGNQGTSFGVVYAAQTGGKYNVTWGGTVTQNIFLGQVGSCIGGASCDSTNSVAAFNGGSYGTNTYADPGFANVTDLLTSWSGAPNCSSYANVNACMARAIADLTPTASGMTGRGYQPPGPCTADPYFPTWLKGVVYLSWNGSTLSENTGLITKPCGM